MSVRDDDQGLREEFALLREADRRDRPEFEALFRPGRSGRHRVSSSRRLATAAATLAAAALVWFAGRDHRPITDPELGFTQRELTLFESPTDFLLDTPGRELLAGVPRFGEADGSWTSTTDEPAEENQP